MECSVSSVIREVHDDGDTVIRAGQQGQKYKALADSTSSLSCIAKAAPTLALPAPAPSETVVDAPGEAQPIVESDTEDQTDHDQVDKTLASGLESSILTMCGLAPAAPTPHAKASAAPAKASGAPANVKAKAQTQANASPPAAPTPLPQPIRAASTAARVQDDAGAEADLPKGRGKAARIPVDIDGVLRHDGYYELEERFEEALVLTDGPTFMKLTLSKPEKAEHATKLKELMTALNNVSKRTNDLDGKCTRRKNCPQGAIDKIRAFRNVVQSMQQIYALSKETEFCAEKLSNLIRSLGDAYRVAIGIRLMVERARARHLVRFQKYTELATLLACDGEVMVKLLPTVPATHQFNEAFLEIELPGFCRNIAGLNTDADTTCLKSMVQLARTMATSRFVSEAVQEHFYFIKISIYFDPQAPPRASLHFDPQTPPRASLHF